MDYDYVYIAFPFIRFLERLSNGQQASPVKTGFFIVTSVFTIIGRDS